MEVRVKKVKVDDFSPKLRAFLGENHSLVTPSSEYDVHAIALFDGVIFFQIVNNIHVPAWLPFILFEVLDGTVPKDWRCNTFPGNEATGLYMLIGPEFIVRDEQSYQEMVELNAEQVDLFWKRIDSLSQKI